MEATKGLILEERFLEGEDGRSIDVLADVLIRCPGHNVCRSAVFGQTFITDAHVPDGLPTFSLLNAKLLQGVDIHGRNVFRILR